MLSHFKILRECIQQKVHSSDSTEGKKKKKKPPSEQLSFKNYAKNTKRWIFFFFFFLPRYLLPKHGRIIELGEMHFEFFKFPLLVHQILIKNLAFSSKSEAIEPPTHRSSYGTGSEPAIAQNPLRLTAPRIASRNRIGDLGRRTRKSRERKKKQRKGEK